MAGHRQDGRVCQDTDPSNMHPQTETGEDVDLEHGDTIPVAFLQTRRAR